MTDRQTDGQTELPWHIRAIATLSRVKRDYLGVDIKRGLVFGGGKNRQKLLDLLLQLGLA